MSKTLDLGSGPEPRNPYGLKEVFGIDIRLSESSNVVAADLNVEKIPFPDNYFEVVTDLITLSMFQDFYTHQKEDFRLSI